jgi:SAM-dependent methyltransferase
MNTVLRDTVKDIDRRFFAGTLRKLNRIFYKYKAFPQQKTYIYKLKSTFKNKITIYLSRDLNKQDKLSQIFSKNNSERGYDPVGINDFDYGLCYSDIYYLIFNMHKDKVKLVIECGIGTKNQDIPWNMHNTGNTVPGAGLRVWRDYFPNAQVIGIDIDPDIMFTENRINTFVCDQTSKLSINNFISKAELKPNTVDIIIDDGCHEFAANICLFENTKHLLTENGVYIIEDFWVVNKEQRLFINYFNKLNDYKVNFINFAERFLIIIVKS